ncbi:MAG: serine hydroxymethyltransferase [Eubacteriales bacterium]|nr:serine hydroxymethyltransferase [Eubacteriales bacterium]
MNFTPSHEFVAKYDPEIGYAMGLELNRQRDHIELIASENFVSPAVLAALGSPLTNKYAEGYPGKRYYGGCEYVDMVETIAIERAKALFHAEHANVQPHAGAQANLAAYQALLQPGDTILAMNLNHGGHLTHGHKVNESGRLYHFVQYGVREDTGYIDYDEMERLAHEHRPKLIVAGASAYSRIIDFERFGRVAKDIGAYFMVDMAHISGLVAAGEHPNPFPYADVVTSTTHKTLRGARGGMILSKAELAQKIDKAVFPGMQGGPLMHVIAAKAVCFHEAMQPEFKTYQHQIILNAAELCRTLQENGIKVFSGGTDTHLMLVDLRERDVTGQRVQTLLDEAHITANRNAIPFDTRNKAETSGVRFGTPAATTRGMKEPEMRQIGNMIARIIKEGEAAVPQVKEEVLATCKRFPLYE